MDTQIDNGMNEPIQRAQQRTGRVTARQLLACIRAGQDSLYTHGKAVFDRPSYSDAFTFTVTSVHQDKTFPRTVRASHTDVETVTKLDVPGYVSNGHTSAVEQRTSTDGRKYNRYTEAFRPDGGFWSLSYCTRDRLVDALSLLPGEAEIAFYVYLDAGTNETLVDAGLHGDHLYLVASTVRRGKAKVRSFLLDVSTGPHNTARFGAYRS